MLYLIFLSWIVLFFSFINLQWFLSVWKETTVSDYANKIAKNPVIFSFGLETIMTGLSKRTFLESNQEYGGMTYCVVCDNDVTITCALVYRSTKWLNWNFGVVHLFLLDCHWQCSFLPLQKILCESLSLLQGTFFWPRRYLFTVFAETVWCCEWSLFVDATAEPFCYSVVYVSEQDYFYYSLFHILKEIFWKKSGI